MSLNKKRYAVKHGKNFYVSEPFQRANKLQKIKDPNLEKEELIRQARIKYQNNKGQLNKVVRKLYSDKFPTNKRCTNRLRFSLSNYYKIKNQK